MRYTLGYIFVLILFTLLAPVCALAAVIAYLAGNIEYADHIYRSMSRMVAALLGKTGVYSTSAQCGAAQSGFFRRLRPLVDWLMGPGHCENEARNEGLIK